MAKEFEPVANWLNKAKHKWFNKAIANEELRSLIRENRQEFETLMAYYRCALMEVETKFNVLNEEFSLQHNRNPIEYHKTRIKKEASIIEKMHRRGLDVDLETMEQNIFDIAGLRIVCSYPQDVYMLADCLLQQDDITLIERKDYIENPKPSGYRSLHLIVEVPIFLRNEKRKMKVEIQLRTIAMDFWASVEHKLQYKQNVDPELAERLAAELADCAEQSAALDYRMQSIRNKITKDLEDFPVEDPLIGEKR